MNGKRDFGAFAQPTFVLALLLLLANDLYLKSQYANWLTGKLSDLAGLYVFAQFFAALLAAPIARVAWVSAGLFIAWKSPLATPLIEFINQCSPLKVHRTVDYTDLIALAVLPLAIRLYTVRTAWQLPCLKYPVAVLALLGIMGTSIIPNAYNVRFDLRDLAGREDGIKGAYAELDKFFAAHGMRCTSCAEESSYREYLDAKGAISAQLNHDKVDQKIFVSLHTYSPETAQAKVDELQAAMAEHFRPRFENVTVLRGGAAPWSTDPRVWKLKIRAAPQGFPLSCSRNGINHSEIARAMEIVDLTARLAEGVDPRHQGCYSSDARCALALCRDTVFGRVIGPGRYDKSIRLSTYGYVGWEGTSLYIEVTERGETRGEAADFMSKLEERLRASLHKDIAISQVKP